MWWEQCWRRRKATSSPSLKQQTYQYRLELCLITTRSDGLTHAIIAPTRWKTVEWITHWWGIPQACHWDHGTEDYVYKLETRQITWRWAFIQVRDEVDHVAVSMPTNSSSVEDNNASENIIYASGSRFGDRWSCASETYKDTLYGIGKMRAIRDTAYRLMNHYNTDSSTCKGELNSRRIVRVWLKCYYAVI